MPLVSKNFSDIITFTRASTATFFDSAGVLQSAANDVPRFDYNPVTLAAQGLLIEESRTDIALYSTLAGAVAGSPGTAPTGWSNFTAGTPTLALTTSIYGTTDQALLYSGNVGDRLCHQQSINVVDGTTYTLSVYCESSSGNTGDVLTVVDGTSTRNIISTTAVNPTGNVGVRVQVVFSVVGTGTVFIRIGLGATGSLSATASVTLSRPQCEAGAFPTSYIPTTTTALTRAADVASVNTLSPWYNASQGTLYAEFVWEGLKSVAGQRIAVIDDGSTSNYWALLATSANAMQGAVVVSGITEAVNSTPATTYAANTLYKQALALELNNSVSAVNGTTGTADTSVSVPSGLTTLRLAASSAGVTSNIWFRRITYYPRRLSDAELQAITA
jgi:hypothetical protein